MSLDHHHFRPLPSLNVDGTVAVNPVRLTTNAQIAEWPVPSTARAAQIYYAQSVRYTLDGSDPTAVNGFPLSDAETNRVRIKVGEGQVLKVIRTENASTFVRVQFLGGDRIVRLAGDHTIHDFADNTVQEIYNGRGVATELLVIADEDWAYAVAGQDPTATFGIPVAADTIHTIPCRKGRIRVIRRSGKATKLQLQAFEDYSRDYHTYPSPFSQVEADVTDSASVTVDAPVPCVFARLAATEGGVYLTVDGSAPETSAPWLIGGTPVDVPIMGGGKLRFLLNGSTDSKVNIAFFK